LDKNAPRAKDSLQLFPLRAERKFRKISASRGAFSRRKAARGASTPANSLEGTHTTARICASFL
jgi:hypothetical protein